MSATSSFRARVADRSARDTPRSTAATTMFFETVSDRGEVGG